MSLYNIMVLMCCVHVFGPLVHQFERPNNLCQQGPLTQDWLDYSFNVRHNLVIKHSVHAVQHAQHTSMSNNALSIVTVGVTVHAGLREMLR